MKHQGAQGNIEMRFGKGQRLRFLLFEDDLYPAFLAF